MRFKFLLSGLLLLASSLILLSCNDNIKSANSLKNSFTDSTRKVNFEYNSRLGNIHAKELGIVLSAEDDYNSTKKHTLDDRTNFLEKYNTSTEKQIVIDSVKKYILNALLNKIIPFWYGTYWSMSGYSDIPNNGEVGCSYFVSNTLLHAGFNINRYKVGKAASEYIAKTFQLSDNVIKLSGYSNLEFSEYVKTNLEEGIYIIGLDYHVGYLLFFKDEVFFIHSSYIFPGTVVIEYAEYSRAFQSHIRVIGEISTNDSLAIKWMKNEYIDVVGEN